VIGLDLPTTLPTNATLRPWPGRFAEQVAELTGTLPPDVKAVTVAQASLVGVRLGTMIRVKDGWTFNGYVGWRWSDPKPEAGLEIRWVAR